MSGVDATKVATWAHFLWTICGEPQGRDEEFWFAAERIAADDDQEGTDSMSVQVRRRREAAAFLQNFVGAQGELLVDTTNNRVQVHDGVTPGGFPAAAMGDLAGRNALINGNFAINQRGYVSQTALAAGVYAHDRWKAGANGCTYAFVAGPADTWITITAGSLIQAIETSNVYATSWWLTWLGSAQARVWQGSASGAFSAGTARTVAGVTVNTMLVTGLAIGAVTSVEFSTGTIGLVQFEASLPNAGPTRFERRQFGHELSLCQRYYQVCYFTFRFPASAQYQSIEVAGVFQAPMRTYPTATNINKDNSNRGNVAQVSVYMMAGCNSSCRFSIVSNGTGDTYAFFDAWALSAEL